MKFPMIALSGLAVLVACASPQEVCVAKASKNLRTMDQLIAETRANLARGFAIKTESFVVNELQKCGVENGEDVFCEVAVADERKVPVAIDLGAEQQKLNSLVSRRAGMAKAVQSATAQCRAQFPEG